MKPSTNRGGKGEAKVNGASATVNGGEIEYGAAILALSMLCRWEWVRAVISICIEKVSIIIETLCLRAKANQELSASRITSQPWDVLFKRIDVSQVA
jgi:hypothetical protein